MMKMSSSVVCAVLLLSVTLSCGRDTTFTLSSAGTEVVIARDKEVMESMVDCAVAGECKGLRTMELLPSGKAFVVKAGTRVATETTVFAFSNVRKVRVLDGDRRGSEGWIYDRILCAGPEDVQIQQAFEKLYLADRNSRQDKG
jgi:hypothetical protein